MSEANVAAARHAVEALHGGDREIWAEGFDPEVEYMPVKEWPEASPRYGTAALWRFIETTIAEWGEWEMQIRDLRENGDRILVETRIRAVGEKSGIDLKGRLFHVFTFEDGRIIKLQDFLAKGEAYEAAGLPT